MTFNIFSLPSNSCELEVGFKRSFTSGVLVLALRWSCVLHMGPYLRPQLPLLLLVMLVMATWVSGSNGCPLLFWGTALMRRYRDHKRCFLSLRKLAGAMETKGEFWALPQRQLPLYAHSSMNPYKYHPRPAELEGPGMARLVACSLTGVLEGVHHALLALLGSCSFLIIIKQGSLEKFGFMMQ